MEKSPEAFRTISEVADWLGVPTHVLRFWESRFSQIKPVKRAGGRRYYRPTDMALIGGIKRLLHDDGMTIRGAQKLLREKGVKHVAALSQPLDVEIIPRDTAKDLIEATAEAVVELDREPAASEEPQPEPDTATEPTPEPEPEPEAETEPEIEAEPAAAEPAVPPAPAAIDQRDVPDNDPEDDDTAFPGEPGLAARVRVADRRYLARNRDALRLVARRLAERASA